MLTPVLAALLAAALGAVPGTALALGANDGAHWAWTAAGACPHFCRCYQDGGLQRADCADRKLGTVELGLPADTEAADLSHNVIPALEDGCFQGLARLRELNLRHNAIRAVGNWAFTGLRRLRLLDLSYNHLQYLHPDMFAANKGLKTLILEGNNFARLPVDRPLLNAPRLQVLDLSSCQLAHLGVAVLSELPALAHLNLSGNLLIQLQPQAVAHQPQLQLLDLTRNPLACDLTTQQLMQYLQPGGGGGGGRPEHNVTVLHPCPPPGALLQSSSKHLARLLTADGPAPAPGPRTHEKMVDISERAGLDLDAGLMNEPESFEGASEELVDATTRRSHSQLNVSYPPFRARDSKNPAFVRAWFDQIPSFWAFLSGLHVGMVLALVLLTYRQCRCRCRRRPHLPQANFRVSGHDSVSGIVADFTSWSCASSEAESLSMLAAARPETPPPAYSEIARG